MDSSRQPRDSEPEEAGASSSTPPQAGSSQARGRRSLQDEAAALRSQFTQRELDSTFQLLEENIIVLMTKELKRIFTRLETDEDPENRRRERAQQEELDEETKYMRRAFLGITVEFLRNMNENQLADRLLRNEQI
ncbi:uncharacterized protein ACB058_006020 [Synchiropus picturatus]